MALSVAPPVISTRFATFVNGCRIVGYGKCSRFFASFWHACCVFLLVNGNDLLSRDREGRIMLASMLLMCFGASVSIIVCLEFIRPLSNDNPFSA